MFYLVFHCNFFSVLEKKMRFVQLIHWSGCYYDVITGIDYFPKHVEIVPICQKSAVEIGNFLFSLMCHHGYSDIHITAKAREFENKVKGELYKILNTTHHITSSHDAMANR